MRALFWTSVALILYAYMGYPVLAWLRARLLPRPTLRTDATPAITLIIPAFNERAAIGSKLENVLRLDYPRDRLEVLVVSDGSTDGTDQIVRNYAQHGIVLLRQEPRAGKTAAENLAVARSRGEILVFSDATTIYEPRALRMLVRHFADPTVGCVGGEEVFMPDPGNPLASRMGFFWRFERFLRRQESAAGTLIGVSGCIFALRRALWAEVDRKHFEDFMLPLRVVARGLRVTYEPEALGYEDAPPSMGGEFARKVRIVAIGMATLFSMAHLLNPIRHGWVSVQLISHKIVRWLTPLALVSAFVAAGALAAEPLYAVVFGVQALLYGVAVAGRWVTPGGRWGRIVGIPHHFCVANLAALMGAIRFMRGQGGTLWNPVR